MEASTIVVQACKAFKNDRSRMLDILWQVQDSLGWISTETMSQIALLTGTYRVEIEGIASFYSFFKTKPQGRFVIHLCDDIIDQHQGFENLRREAESILGISIGETTSDDLFSLHTTPCIGMSDQAPAGLINNEVFTRLTPGKLRTLIKSLKKSRNLKDLKKKPGDGNNALPLIDSRVSNNIKLRGKALLTDPQANTIAPNAGLKKTLAMPPQQVIETIMSSGLKGRGGAGYEIARKWQMATDTQATRRFIICNADEGEPGTFKDRVLLTERAEALIEGMTIAGYAIGSHDGIIYLRAEYRYLLAYLEHVIREKRKQGLLGKNISFAANTAKTRFSFDIRIQLGAGAYICGEESSLISSCEGKRGEPKNKPPYPAQSGYLGFPTVVNNVETLCNLPMIMAKGSGWFRSIGTEQSPGTKLLSVCGDCSKPGIYEVDMGTPLQHVLDMAGARDPEAIQIGGASGQMIGKNDFNRRLCNEDLPTAGAIMIFSKERNILKIVDYFMRFFIDESCGYCTPCRVGNVFMQQCLEKIMKGQGEASDLDYLRNLGKTVSETSRCGLGHTSPNPILSSMKNFPLVYSALLEEHPDGRQAGFNIQAALDESRVIAKRRSLIYDPDFGADQ